MSETIVRDDNQESVSNQDKIENDVVKYSTHNKLLGQHKRTKEEMTAVQTELMELKRQNDERENAELAKQGEFKKLVELRDQKINELLEQLEQKQGLVEQKEKREADTWKLQAFHSKLPGKIKNMEYMTHADIDSIVYDGETMQCDLQSVEAVVNKFMESHGHLVEPLDHRKLPSQSPNNTVNNTENLKNRTPQEQLAQGLTELFK